LGSQPSPRTIALKAIQNESTTSTADLVNDADEPKTSWRLVLEDEQSIQLDFDDIFAPVCGSRVAVQVSFEGNSPGKMKMPLNKDLIGIVDKIDDDGDAHICFLNADGSTFNQWVFCSNFHKLKPFEAPLRKHASKAKWKLASEFTSDEVAESWRIVITCDPDDGDLQEMARLGKLSGNSVHVREWIQKKNTADL